MVILLLKAKKKLFLIAKKAVDEANKELVNGKEGLYIYNAKIQSLN
jgi:hypothetical protein